MDNGFYISEDKDLLDVQMVVDYLRNQSYWAQDRSADAIRKSIQNSYCFGVYNTSELQVGFARVVTDFTTFAWLMDVFILEEHRTKGLGKRLLNEIFSHPELKNVMKWGLGTRDAHELYKKFGFTSLSRPETMMERKGVNHTTSRASPDT